MAAGRVIAITLLARAAGTRAFRETADQADNLADQLEEVGKAQDKAFGAGRVKALTALNKGLGGLRTGTTTGAKAVLGLGAASAGVFAVMGAGVAGVAAGIAGLGITLALQNKELRQVFTDTFAEIKKQAVSLAAPFVGPLKQVAGIIRSTFGAIAPQLKQAFATVAPAIVPLAQGISGMVKNLSAIFVPLAQVGAKILAGLGPALTQLGSQLVALLRPVLDALNSVGAGLFQTLIGGIGNVLAALGPLLGTLVRVGAQLLGPLLQAINIVVGALVAALIPVLNALAPVFIQLVGALAPLIAQLVSGLSPILVALAPILGRVFAVLQPVIAALISALQPVLAALVPVIGLLVDAFGRVILALLPLLPPLSQLITSLISGLMPVLTPIITLLSQTAATIVGALVQALITAMPAVKSIALAIASLLPALLPLVPLWSQWLTAILPLIGPLTQVVVMLTSLLVPVLRVIITVLVKLYTTVFSLIIPVFRLMVTAITWVVNAIRPAAAAIGAALAAVGRWATWLWQVAIGPAFRAIATVAKWLLAIIVVAVAAPIIVAFKLLAAVARWLWSAVIRPVFTAIANHIRAVYNTIIRPVLAALNAYFRNVLAPVFRWIVNTIIKPLWNSAGLAIRMVWNTFIRPAFDAIKRGVAAVKSAFSGAVSGIKTVWDRLKGYTKAPVTFFVNTVYMGGIKRVWDGVKKLVPALPGLPSVKFATGGVLGGYAPGNDSVMAMLSPGEGILRPEAVRALGSDWIHGINAAARQGGSGAVTRLFGGVGDPAGLPGFQFGGIVSALKKPINFAKHVGSELLSKGANFVARKVLDPILKRIPGGAGLWGRALSSLPRTLINAFLDFIKKTVAPNLGGGGSAKAVQAVRSQIGTPYSWGGGGPHGPSFGFGRGAGTRGFDCSSLMQYGWYQAARKVMPRTTYTQRPWLRRISNPVPGAVGQPHSGHTYMYAGNSRIVEAPFTGARVREVPMRSTPFWGLPPWKMDAGGAIPPRSLALVHNASRRSELVMSGAQQDILAAGGGGAQHLHLYLDGRQIAEVIVDPLKKKVRTQAGGDVQAFFT